MGGPVYLLELATVLREKFEQRSDHFNIFSILRSESDEVNLHSQFLYVLLLESPDFLNELFNEIGTDLPEERIAIFKEKDDIDILLTWKRNAIIIENKIYAKDQEKQIQRYWDILWNRGFSNQIVVYLTLDGREPSSNSLGTVPQENLRLFSYEDTIRRMISNTIRASATRPYLRECLCMYKDLIEKITQGGATEIMVSEIGKEIASSSKNMKSAILVQKGYEAALIEIQGRLWKRLEDMLSIRFEIESSNWKENISAFYRNKRANDRYWYGINFKVPEKGDLIFRIEIEDTLYLALFPHLVDRLSRNRVTQDLGGR